MFNYRTNPHGIRPMGGNYFRTPPGQRTQRQSFNRPIPPANKPLSSKPMGSRPSQTSPQTVKQGEKFQDSKLSRPSVEQVSPAADKKEEKGPNGTQASPAVVQQTSKQSTVKQDSNESSTKRPSSPTAEAKNEKTSQHPSAPSNDPPKSKSKDEDDMSWSPPPPDPPQKPLSIPLAGVGDSAQRTETVTKVPFGATPSSKTSSGGRSEADTKVEPAATNLNDPPFQSQVMKGQGHQYKKPSQFRFDDRQQQRQQQTAPAQKSESTPVESPTNTDQTQRQNTQQGSGNTSFRGRRPGGPSSGGRWGKTDRPRRSEPNPSPMETEYEMDPKVDRSILNAEPKEHVKKFTNRSRLFIGGILSADEKLLKDMFIKFGEISELWLNKEKGFGFVKMDTKANCQRAIDHYNGQERMSSMVRVRFAAKNSSVKVNNLTHAVTNELLEEAFKIFGEVEHAVVACDERGKSLGWGVVDFAMKKSAMLAITRCKEGLFILCKSPIPVMVVELKDEDLEEGMIEKTMHKNILYQREREDGPRFAMPGSMDYQLGVKWKSFLENSRSEREILEDRIKAERIQLENETEGEVIHYLEEQDNLRHQETLRRQEEQRKIEENKRQDNFRQQEMIKQESRRRNQSMRMHEDISRREDSLRRDGEFLPTAASEDRSYDRSFGGGQTQPSEMSFGYSQDYEHGYNTEKSIDWQSAGSSYKKDWGGDSGQGYGGSGGYQTQGRGAQSGYDDYPGYSSQSQYEQRHSGSQQYGEDSYRKDRGSSNQGNYGSGDQYMSDTRRSGGGGYGGYSSGTGQSGGDSYRNFGSNTQSYGTSAQNYGSTDYSESGYGTGYGSSSQAAHTSADRSWISQQDQGGYDGAYQSGGTDTGGTGGGYDRRRPHVDDWQAEKAGYSYSGLEKRRKL